MIRVRTCTPFVAALLLAACGPQAVLPPIEDLAAPADSISTTFTDITEAVWLGDRRWAVLAPGQVAVRVADFADGTMALLPGARGRDGVFQQPYAIFRALDSLHVADWQARALTIWSLDGQLGGQVGPAAAARGSLPAARDGSGAWYAELRPQGGSNGRGTRDSTWLLRLSDGGARADTVGALSPADLAEVRTEGGRRFETRVFSGRDGWGVKADGTVWIARVNGNLVELRTPGGEIRRGPPLPDPVLQVTQADRDLFVESFAPELRQTASRLPFAELKPPFERAFTAPGDVIWLEKSKALADSTRLYQVVAPDGSLARIVRVSGFGRVRGASPDRVLVTRFVDGAVRLYEQRLP
jgi:hypothetical protein